MFVKLAIILFPLIFTLLLLVKKGYVWENKVFASYFITVAVLASLFVYFGETNRLHTLHDVFWLVIFPSMLLFAVLLSLSRIKRHSAE